MSDPHTTPDDARDETLLVVGIGASAGGLEALREVATTLSPKAHAAYVVAQHLSPSHASMLAELLSSHTDLEVCNAEHNAPLRPGCIHITPPNQDVTLQGSVLNLAPPGSHPGPKPSVDRLFQSIAEEAGERGIGIVLSGTGTDGALGMRAIKAAGGITVAQEPGSAKYDGMPRAAVQTGCVDRVEELSAIGPLILRIATMPPEHWREQTKLEDAEIWQRLVNSVRRASGLDFSHYKRATVNRRIGKRMGLAHLDDMADYARLLEKDPVECKALVRDLLISVTEFFRDAKPFKALRHHLAEVLANRDNSQVFRVWVPGCASGEEAYSLAILLSEIARELGQTVEFLIFATDLDLDALNRGRNATYQANALDGIDDDLIDRYFDRDDTRFTVKKFIRQSIVFAPQNVVDDPPFSRVDLISCRNLLIYFNREAQDRVIELFHYALNSGGTLFLGNSEAIEHHRSLFQEIDRPGRVFGRRNDSRTLPRPSARRSDSPPKLPYGRRVEDRARGSDPASSMLQRVVEAHCGPMVVLDDQDQAIHFFGDVRRYLHFPSGPAEFGIFDLVPTEMRAELRALLYRSRRRSEEERGGVVTINGETVRPVVRVLSDPDDGLRSLSFESEHDAVVIRDSDNAPPGASDKSAMIIGELEGELASTRMRLQTVVEELETSNEELQSQGEELQSANEEMQSTNEELQTSNEELQSTNEELMTLNEELKSKSDELESTASALANIKESLDFPLLVVDMNVNVLQFNSAAKALCNEADQLRMGAALMGLDFKVNVIELLPMVKDVMAGRAIDARQLCSEAGDTYAVHCMAYLSARGQMLGVLISLVDVTARVAAENDLRDTLNLLTDAKERSEITLSSISDGVITTNTSLAVTYMNPAAAALLRCDREAAIDQPLDEVFHLQSADDDVLASDPVRRALAQGQPITQAGRRFLDVPGDEQLAIECSAAPLNNHEDTTIGAVLAFRDVTSHHLLTEELSYRASHDPLTGLINRDAFEGRVDALLRELREEGGSHVLLFLDLDQFKIVNDTAGHAAGDELLRQICQELRHGLRQSDVLARLGGDEFGVALRHCSASRGQNIADTLVDTVRGFRFAWGDQTFTIGVSIGMVVLDHANWSVADAFSAADAACYQAKEAGRSRVQVAEPGKVGPNAPRLSDMHVVNRVNAALDDRRIRLFAEFAGRANAPNSYVYREFLARMVDQQGEIVQPAQFIPAAERYYLMNAVDRYVLREALERLESEADHDRRFDGVTAINLSGQSIGDSQFLDVATSMIREADIDAERLCIEITETAAISHLTEAVRLMKALKTLGCRFALDDFGAGMSSFSYLRTLPVDYIKIDGSFVHNMARSVIDRTMIEAVAKIGAELKLQTIAEHVRSAKVARALADMGVDMVQGQLIGLAAPLPALDD